MTDRPHFLDTASFIRISDIFAQNGWQLWAVGGCVRDALLTRPIGDIDLCSDALPQDIIAAFSAANHQVIPTGLDHGTVTILSDGTPYEVTTLRRDLETNGRHAMVTFTTNLSEDAARRDFTMNALYMTPQGKVIDPLDGMADLRARNVRFVGDPDQRITEDYLRILRFFRFHAWYGRPGHADLSALAACRRHGQGVATLSRERVGNEMRRLLSAENPAEAVGLMYDTGVFDAVLPGARPHGLAALMANEATANNKGGWLRRLAALIGRNPIPADDLRLSRAEQRHLTQLAHACQGEWSLDQIGYHLPPAIAVDAAILRGLGNTPGWQAGLSRASTSPLPIAARDLPDLAGRDLGAGLRAAERAWLASGFTLGPRALCNIARTGAAKETP